MANENAAAGGDTGGKAGDAGADGAGATGDAAAKATADAAAAAAAATKAEGDKVAADAKAAADAAAAAAGAKKAPDKYELKLAEKTTLDDSDVKSIEAMARDNGWTNDEAQAALDIYNAKASKQADDFLTAAKADKEYGGDNFTQSQVRADAGINAIRPASHPRAKAFRAMLAKAGISNHIEILSFLADLGKRTEEDGGAHGDGTGGGVKRNAEDVLYGGTPAKS